MKKMFNKVVAGLLAVCMIICYMPIAYAVETEKMTEADAGTVNVFASSVTVQQSADEQTVDIVLLSDKNIQVSGLDVGYTCSSGATLGVGVPGNELSGSPTNQAMVVTNGNGAYMTYSSENSGYVLCTVPVTIAANATGSCTVSFNDIEIYDADNGDGYSLNSNTVTSTITIESTTPEGGESGEPGESTEPTGEYTAAISANKAQIVDGQQVIVTVTVTGNYNAAEIEVSYPSILTYTSSDIASDEVTVDSDTSGKIFIVDKGSENAGATYNLTFTANSVGTAEVTLDYVALGTRESSVSHNLTEVIPSTASVEIEITPKTFNVTFPKDEISNEDLFQSDETPTQGADFTFTATNDNYTYNNVEATVNGTPVNVTNNGDGTWTIPGASINGDIAITVNNVAKQYNVGFTYVDANGDTQTGSATATYGSDYTYTMPEGVAPEGAVNGFHYEIDSILINGVQYNNYTQNLNTREVIIEGEYITGEVVITLKQVEDLAENWAVAVAGDATNAEYDVVSSVKKNDPVTLTIIPQDEYDYEVTAKYTGTDTVVNLTKNGNAYTTVSGVTANITFVITKTVKTEGVFEVELYLDGGMGEPKNQNMYLIKMTTKLTGSHYACDGVSMYWSEKYDAYCYLVIAATEPAAADFEFTIKNGEAVAISYDMDVNKTTFVDANDAQLVYDMYNKVYNVITNDVTVEKFLKADVNTTVGIDTDDAATIVKAVVDRMMKND